MSSVARGIGTLVIWIMGATAIYWTCLVPYHCDVIEKRTLALTVRAENFSTNTLYASHVARDNLTQLQPCIKLYPTVNSLMIAAANEQLLGRYTAAVSFYEEAMRYDRRPELYLNLGLAQINAGQTATGVDNLVAACISNPWLIDDISVYHDEVYKRLSAYKAHIDELKARER